jgi:prolyl oligopeptidase
VYVVANIRGGGEYGPRWHQAALKENRQRAFDDFIAVAQDLIKRKISPRHLGIEGGSNGGLLVGAVMTQRPDLFNAVVCEVPLLDMRATASCWPARPGWANTATRTCRPTGSTLQVFALP